MAKITKASIKRRCRVRPRNKKSGKNKIPTVKKNATAIRKISPIKNAFIL
jgi:hypothetical protein